MSLDELLNRRLLIVSGKGGVGKTSVATSLGLIASRKGKKTLITEVNAAERIAELFGLKSIGYRETKLAENLFAINIDSRSAFEEYILEQIYSKKLYHLIFENRFVKNFLDATPGLNELLIIGKIWALAERDPDPLTKKLKYDLVIVDAPATGHGLAFLDVPQVVASAVRLGPLKTKATNIVNLLQDPLKTLLIIVTLAEEMPVNEAMEMLHVAQTSLKIATGPLFVNAVFPPFFTELEWREINQQLKKIKEEDSSIQRALNTYQKRVMLQRFYINKLKLSIGTQGLFELPYLFRPRFNRSAIEELAKHILNFSPEVSWKSSRRPEKNQRKK